MKYTKEQLEHIKEMGSKHKEHMGHGKEVIEMALKLHKKSK